MNELMREYVKLYFGEAHANAYFFETTETGFGACFLIKATETEANATVSDWDSIHSFTVEETATDSTFTLVSTILLHVDFGEASTGKAKIAGNSQRKIEKTIPLPTKNNDYIETMGRMMETNETNLRNEMDEVYVGKTKQIINTGRLTDFTKQNKLL